MAKGNNSTKKQGMRWPFNNCKWTLSLLICNIIFLLFELGNAMVVKIDLETSSNDGKVNLGFNLNQDNAKIANDSEFCKDATFDAIFTYQDDTFVLKGDHYWKLTSIGLLAADYPKPISQKWPGLPSNIDTAFTDKSGQYIYFFKGPQYWKFAGEKLEEGYPKDIRSDFRGVPNDLQAALVWNGNGYVYLFKGEYYWRVDMSKQPFEISDKTAIKLWIGIPGNLDAALPSKGLITYFFKDGKYYKYNDKTESVEIDDPPYPKRVASNWFGCPKVVKIIEY